MKFRGAPRRPAAKYPWITGIRVQPIGCAATLADISSTGVKVRCGVRIKPGNDVTVVFQGTLTPKFAHGRVARCDVGGVGKDHPVLYDIGIVFDEPLTLPKEEQTPAIPSDTVAVEAPPDPIPSVENRW